MNQLKIKLIGEHEKGLMVGVCCQLPASDSSVNSMLFGNSLSGM
uniref:Uncharacterized protein n=1 Tax=Anguilla anguilla TaxID=7936 RepID=A0A0E9RAG0_ANGAN